MKIPTDGVNWLLDANDPSVRYRAFTEFLDADQTGAQVEIQRCWIV